MSELLDYARSSVSAARVAFLVYLGLILGLVALVLDKLAHGLTVIP